jgi:hypothetical protein
MSEYLKQQKNAFTQPKAKGYDPDKTRAAQLKELEYNLQKPPLQKFAKEEGDEKQLKSREEEQLQMKSESGSEGISTNMPEDVKSKMENSFGTDFSDVSIHKNSEQATNIGALAYTQGSDVHFAPGQYEPGSHKGQELLGHELTHVVQQREGRVKPDTEQQKGLNINSDNSLEKEADEMGARAAQGKMANVRGNGDGVQMQKSKESTVTEEPEMAEEQIEQAIACNNALGLSALSISYLQMGLCLTPTGVFDEDTVLAIGKVSIENRVEPLLQTLADAKLREYIQMDFQQQLGNNERDQKKYNRNTSKLDELGDKRPGKKARLESDIQEIEDKYISPFSQNHLLATEGIDSSDSINSEIAELRSKFTASDGELDTSTFRTIFNQMVADKIYNQILQLSIEYDGFDTDKNTLSVNYDSETAFSYRVQIPFSQLEVNPESDMQTITNAPNVFKKILIGESAFVSYNTLLNSLSSANMVSVEQGALAESTTETENELTKEQIDKAISNNGFLFSEEKSILLIQAIIGTTCSGVFDENTIRSISSYQIVNNISRTDGNLNKDTLNQLLIYANNNNEQNAVLSIMKDYYSLNLNSDKEISLKYSADQTEVSQKDNSLPDIEQISFGDSAFTNGLTGLHTAFKDVFGYEKTIEHEMMETLFSDSKSERETAVWSNPNTNNQGGLVASIRENFPNEQDISNYLSRTDISNEDKIAGLGALSVELGRLEFLMGVIYHGGNDKTWETDGANKGPFVNYYKSKVGNNVNDRAWCTMFSGYLKRMLGFASDLSTTGPRIFNSGIRLDRWATDGFNVINGIDDFDDPSDYENYSGESIDTDEWIELRNNLSVSGLNTTQKQETLNTFLSNRFTPQPGDIIVINPQSTTTNESNEYHNGGFSHTLTIESFNSPIITTIEGNKDQKATGTSIDLTNSSEVIKILFMARIGVEFYSQNGQNELATNQNTDFVNLDHLLDPIKIMVRNLQLLADQKKYINSNVENSLVYDMGDGATGGSTI